MSPAAESAEGEYAVYWSYADSEGLMGGGWYTGDLVAAVYYDVPVGPESGAYDASK